MNKIVTLFIALLLAHPAFGQDTFLHMQSEHGDPIGQGNTYEFDETTGTFEVNSNNYNGITATYNGGTGQLFTIHISPKEGDDLIIGPYPMATSRCR